MNQKLCPLRVLAWDSLDDLTPIQEQSEVLQANRLACLEEKCAWWETNGQCCAIRSISISLAEIEARQCLIT